jgi:hypothetical protein
MGMQQNQQQGRRQERLQPQQQAQQVIYVFYVDTEEKLAEAAKEWGSCSELGIDIECENNLHHYGAYISWCRYPLRTKIGWLI